MARPFLIEGKIAARLWWTWPAWVYFAFYLEREQERLLEDIKEGRYVP